jgi:hypothetical protein
MLLTTKTKNKETRASIAFAIVMIALAIFGGWRNYSPVPFWDMWAAPEFYSEILHGNNTAWWHPHNEHRIVIARALFWMDNVIFSGKSIFLLCLNYVFPAISVLMFWKIMRYAERDQKISHREIIFICFITAALYSWMQKENFTWAFQSQFFLAQLLPLIGLYFLAKFVTDSKKTDLLIALVLGVCAVGAMANGVLILPMMFAFLLLFQQKRRYAILPLILSIVVFAGYFYQLQFPSSTVKFSDALKDKPFDFVAYILMYLGNPVHHLVAKGTFGHYCAFIGGVVFVSATINVMLKMWRSKDVSPVLVGLLFFVFYIGATAVATARGRFIFGPEQALSSRYTTPTLMAWCAVVILLWLNYKKTYPDFWGKKKTKIAVYVVSVLMLGLQLGMFRGYPEIERREIAALAVALNIKDVTSLNELFPDPDMVLSIGQKAIKENTSLFQTYPYHDVPVKFGTTYQPASQASCKVSLIGTEVIPDVGNFIWVNGAFEKSHSLARRNLLYFRNQAGVIVGFALKSKGSEFKGYIAADEAGQVVDVMDAKAQCYGSMQLK